MRYRRAVLVVHGFTGKLYDNEYLVNLLQLNGRFDVFAFTLPGHDKFRLEKVKKEEWVKSVDDQIKLLIKNHYDTIYLVGHSMGGLIVSMLANNYRQIKKVVLIAPALSYFSTDQYKEDLINFKETMLDEDVNYKNLFIKAFQTSKGSIKEFHQLVDKNNKKILSIKKRILIIHGDKDEVVPLKSSLDAFKNIKYKRKNIKVIKNGRHNILRGKKKEEVSKYIESYLVGGLRWLLMNK
ncbi:MAG: alpha/beta fold hydrolase [Bacilli bacterium]|nr:alpha/beta fold hydrolase [Bacilli bacterium]